MIIVKTRVTSFAFEFSIMNVKIYPTHTEDKRTDLAFYNTPYHSNGMSSELRTVLRAQLTGYLYSVR